MAKRHVSKRKARDVAKRKVRHNENRNNNENSPTRDANLGIAGRRHYGCGLAKV